MNLYGKHGIRLRSSTKTHMVGILALTKKDARRFLKDGINVRRVNEKDVEKYRKDIDAGKWVLSTQTLIFDLEGRMTNGQHTCKALLNSGKDSIEVQCQIRVSGKATQDDIDAIDGGKSRNPGDNFGQGGRIITARLRAALTFVCGYVPPPMSTYQLRQAYQIFKPGIEWSMKALQGKTTVASAPVAGALAFAHAADPKAVEALGKRLMENVPYGASDPAARLLRYLLEPKRHNGMRTQLIGGTTLHAAYLAVHGEKAETLDASNTTVIEFFLRAHEQVPSSRKKKTVRG